MILVIEDNRNSRFLICEILRQAGFYVLEAENGFEGLLMARRLPFDLVICDVNMPKINGFEFLAALHQRMGAKTIPVIMLTSNSDYQYQKSASELGASAYLVKPINSTTLLTTVAEQLNQQISNRI